MPTSDHTFAVPAFVAVQAADPGHLSAASRRIPAGTAALLPAPPARRADPAGARPTPPGRRGLRR